VFALGEQKERPSVWSAPLFGHGGTKYVLFVL